MSGILVTAIATVVSPIANIRLEDALTIITFEVSLLTVDGTTRGRFV